MNRVMRIAFIVILVLPISVLIYYTACHLCENKRDPVYQSLDSLRFETLYTLSDRADSIQHLFVSLQNDTGFQRTPAIEIISKPFLPIMEYTKLRDFILYLSENKRAIVSGVTGSGKTTLIDRVAKFLAVDETQIMRIECVENLEAEYHRNYIGYYTETSFQPGRMLRFFERCSEDSLQNYVLLIDDIDKIYPATLFGAAIWGELDNPAYKNGIEGYNEDISIPNNLFLISVTHEGPGSTIPLNAEHFRRLGRGGTYPVNPNYKEFFLHLKSTLNLENIPDTKWHDLHKLIYFFESSNRMIAHNYGPGYTLAQWSDVRKLRSSADIPNLMQMMISHVNAFNPPVHLKEEDFEDILFRLDNNGMIPRSSPLAKIYNFIVDVGIFGELSATIIIGIISLMAGFWMFYRKRKFIRNIVKQTYHTPNYYRQGQLSYDQARGKLLLIQDAVQEYILKRKINFSEANYILINLNEQLKQIEEHRQMGAVSSDLEKMIKKFTADGVLDDKEYAMLNDFLEGMKNSIQLTAYQNFKNTIDDIYRKSLAKLEQNH